MCYTYVYSVTKIYSKCLNSKIHYGKSNTAINPSWNTLPCSNTVSLHSCHFLKYFLEVFHILMRSDKKITKNADAKCQSTEKQAIKNDSVFSSASFTAAGIV